MKKTTILELERLFVKSKISNGEFFLAFHAFENELSFKVRQVSTWNTFFALDIVRYYVWCIWRRRGGAGGLLVSCLFTLNGCWLRQAVVCIVSHYILLVWCLLLVVQPLWSMQKIHVCCPRKCAVSHIEAKIIWDWPKPTWSADG